MASMTCRVCQNAEGNTTITAREMMFGTRERFSYLECRNCGCLQIQEIPKNLAQYYPDNYYSYDERKTMSPIRIWLKRRLINYYMNGNDLIGKVLSKKFDQPFNPEWLKKTSVNRDSAILDLGCGSGILLLHLQIAGFRNLTGADPFIKGDIRYPGDLNIFKQPISDVQGAYDLIMMHHALEHMPDQDDVLKHAYRLLKPGGFALVRIPITGIHAWKTYRENWVQLDAPRHLYLHTPKSLGIVAERHGLQFTETVFESNAFQFWGSEQYKQDIPLRDPRSYGENPERSMFTPEQIQDWEQQAQELNRNQDGDTASFYLQKPA